MVGRERLETVSTGSSTTGDGTCLPRSSTDNVGIETARHGNRTWLAKVGDGSYPVEAGRLYRASYGRHRAYTGKNRAWHGYHREREGQRR